MKRGNRRQGGTCISRGYGGERRGEREVRGGREEPRPVLGEQEQ